MDAPRHTRREPSTAAGSDTVTRDRRGTRALDQPTQAHNRPKSQSQERSRVGGLRFQNPRCRKLLAMPGHTKVLNQRQILFAEAVALGTPQVEAYRIAG